MSEACGRAAGRLGVRVAQRDSGVRAGTCLPREPGGAAGGASTRQPGAGPGAAPPAPALENRYACALMWGEHDPREAWQAKPTASPQRSRVGCRPAVRPFRVGVIRSVGPRGLAAAARGLQRDGLWLHTCGQTDQRRWRGQSWVAASCSSREVWEAVLEGCSVVVLRAGRGEIAKAKHSGRLCQASLHAFTPRLPSGAAARKAGEWPQRHPWPPA